MQITSHGRLKKLKCGLRLSVIIKFMVHMGHPRWSASRMERIQMYIILELEGGFNNIPVNHSTMNKLSAI
jgi:hypothetical protein